MVKLLSSIQNPEIKKFRLLFQKARERKKQNLFVIEGEREIEKALKGGYFLESIFIHEAAENSFDTLISQSEVSDIFLLASSIFNRLSVRSGSEKILAIAQSKTHELVELTLSKTSLILVIEAPEKPGNIGALYRTAAAAKMDAVIIANPKTDFYNPNSIRSSLGSLFLIPTAIGTSKEVIALLDKKSIRLATAVINPEAIYYNDFDYAPPCAIVMGTESTGLDELWLKKTDQHLIIPMAKNVDSLNLSVSAGILMYEAQRKNNRFE
tara:strand:- start:816 stop:1616 length:801 start_codon:yes stop_codon:yes gene_type:complete